MAQNCKGAAPSAHNGFALPQLMIDRRPARSETLGKLLDKQLVHVRVELGVPVRGRKARGFQLAQIQRGMFRARGHGTGGVGVVALRGNRHHLGTVAVSAIEHHGRDLRPAGNVARVGAIVDAVGRGSRGLHVAFAVTKQVEDGARHGLGEGKAAHLVVNHDDLLEGILGVGAAIGQHAHGLHEVVPLADDPAGAQDVVRGVPLHREVTGGLGLAVDGQRRRDLVLGVERSRAVEHVVRAHVHEREAVLSAGAGEQGRPRGVGGPADAASLGSLSLVHRGVGAAVDHGAVDRPVVLGVRRWVGHVERVDVAVVEGIGQAALLSHGAHGTAQLTVAAGHERAARGHGQGVSEHGVRLVGLGELALLQRDGPLDGELGVGQVHEGVGLLELERPVGVHQVGVGGAVLQGLVGVAHAARHEDGARGVERAGEDLPEARTGAQVHPRAEDRAGGHGDELVPGLGVDAAGDALVVVEGDVVLHEAEVGDARRHHLLALPVLLEPAAVVAVDGELHHLEPGDAGLRDGELLLEIEFCHEVRSFPKSRPVRGDPPGSSPCPQGSAPRTGREGT